MTRQEIIDKILANEWWPFDQVDPTILEEIQKMDKQQALDDCGEALL